MPQKNNKKLLNLGCGSRYHKDWINIDFVSNNKDILTYDLLKGLPYKDNTFDVVYHSHLIEHFSKETAINFIKECYRILKFGGVIRITTPNLEEIVKNYTKYLNQSLQNVKTAEFKYDWTMVEMYDQCVRNFTGGEMGKIYSTGNIPNPDFVYERTGIRIERKSCSPKIKVNIKNRILKFIFREKFKIYEIGKFRLSGEIHQWMYDRFSLKRLLVQNKFKDVKICTASESRVPKWNSYNLDINPDGTVYKPDSIFIEAVK